MIGRTETAKEIINGDYNKEQFGNQFDQRFEKFNLVVSIKLKKCIYMTMK